MDHLMTERPTLQSRETNNKAALSLRIPENNVFMKKRFQTKNGNTPSAAESVVTNKIQVRGRV